MSVCQREGVETIAHSFLWNIYLSHYQEHFLEDSNNGSVWEEFSLSYKMCYAIARHVSHRYFDLDGHLGDDRTGELKQLHQNIGITMVYITHDQEEKH